IDTRDADEIFENGFQVCHYYSCDRRDESVWRQQSAVFIVYQPNLIKRDRLKPGGLHRGGWLKAIKPRTSS
ncbi:MAG: hypothetical protein WCL39_15745, partial [Armatimonadota bacterium]